MLELRGVNLSRGKKDLLIDASVRVERGDVVGLVGRNGAGKSSLFQLLLGQLKEDAGNVRYEIKPDQIAHLEQVLPNTEQRALEYVKSGDHLWVQAQQQLEAAEAADDGMAIARAHTMMHDIDAYTIDTRAAIICHGLGFDDAGCRQLVSDFSGGWQMRLQLARVLISRADCLLLDEPTNHLDIDAIVWLENYLCSQAKTVVLISHDRDFMDNVCNHIMYLAHRRLQMFTGNYTSFAKQYDLQCSLQAQQREKILKKRAHMQSFVDRFRAKASKARQAQGRLKALEKMQVGEALQQESPFSFQFYTPEKSASPAIKVHGSMGYGEHVVLSGVDLSLGEGDRIGLLGKNGQGKSTFVKSIAGSIPLLSGQLQSHPNVKLAHFSQHGLDLMDSSATPMVLMLRMDPQLSEQKVRQYLGGYDFSGDRVFEPIHIFSGGERARLHLAMLIYQRPNVLLLDEPTNHLDMQMREALSVALQAFSGTLVVVSHDRHFLGTTVNDLWWIHDGQCRPYTGDLKDYKQLVLSEGKPSKSSEKVKSVDTKKTAKPKASTDASKLSRQDQKRLQQLERRIARVNEKLALMEERLADSTLYQPEKASDLDSCVHQHRQIQEELQRLEAEWLSLQDQ